MAALGNARTLRLTEQPGATPDEIRVEIALEGAGPRLTARSTFKLAITAQDRADLRWYLEDYLQFPLDPAPEIAARIEGRMAALGEELCRGVFLGNRDATRIWDKAREDLADTRVETITAVQHAAAVPWELIRDPDAHVPLALEARAFVRAHGIASKSAKGAAAVGSGPIRILLVICRPGGDDDVPFRSVASKLLKGLDEASREHFQLEVLRPPTFEELSRVLRKAKAAKNPYHVVHFDGHGAYGDASALADLSETGLSKDTFKRKLREGTHGYLVFEAAGESTGDRGDLIAGPDLGSLLVETGVPILVLNACRSAHSDPYEKPETADDATPHDEVASFGSLALEVMDKGVSGVVAMRYNVYVVTAAQLVADLYEALVEGSSLGEAVTRGRKQLHAKPEREIAYSPRPLQDWCVPVVYEVEPLPLFPAPVSSRGLKLSLDNKGSSLEGVPPPPDTEFIGRDETLLALDRAFDKHSVVLLHAYAGSGKTSTAAEFARWYSATGGVRGPVLWTSFEHKITLPRVLDSLGKVFGPVLEQNGIQWLALDDDQRREIALQVMKQIPVLWIWDNVEPVAGFPEGTESAWSADEQRELVGFLRAARQTKAKVLLTSRRDEQRWLGELPARVRVPPMPMQERVMLARALAGKRGARITDVADWRPLLRFTQGNPLAITVLVGQALKEELRTRAQIEAFVEKLRAGEGAFEDDEEQGRSRSLGASLSYGFAAAFGEEDRKRLALLHLFQGFVDVDALRIMGEREMAWCLHELRGISREEGMRLLDRAAEIGLLMPHGGGYYSIHPALPWYFRGLFEAWYPAERKGGGGADALAAIRAYVEAMGALGAFYHDRYGEGHRDHLAMLGAEEPNLLHAWALARKHGWWGAVVGPMQGLRMLYGHAGRRLEWARLVEAVTADFVDPQTGGPLAGREEEWRLFNEYRVNLMQESRQWEAAERLQRVHVRVMRERAAGPLASPIEALDARQRSLIRTLAVSVETLGHIQRQLGQAECVDSYDQAFEMFERIELRTEAAVIAFNLGHAYKDLPAIRDLAEAERWYQRSLEMRGEEQRHGRAGCLAQLGLVARERFKEARAAKKPEEELLQHLNAALRFDLQALELLPADAVDDLAVTHQQLGNIYGDAGDIDRALPHYQHAIRYREQQGNHYGAARARFNVAELLRRAGRLADARAYGLAALRNLETYGDRAADDIRDTKQLLVLIDRDLAGQPPEP